MAYRIVRIDPFNQKIAVLALPETTKNYFRPLQRMTRAKTLGHQRVCEIEAVPLLVAAEAAVGEELPGFRFRGCKAVTAGIGVLFGKGVNGGFTGSPADKDWVERHIVWMTAAAVDAEEAAQRAAEAAPEGEAE
jgi:hypothetical protein